MYGIIKELQLNKNSKKVYPNLFSQKLGRSIFEVFRSSTC
jgi:hypothetical protein